MLSKVPLNLSPLAQSMCLEYHYFWTFPLPLKNTPTETFRFLKKGNPTPGPWTSMVHGLLVTGPHSRR